jgi:prepilin-type processing-associated H-X9-DG protein
MHGYLVTTEMETHMRYKTITCIALCLFWLCGGTALLAQDLTTPEVTVRSFLTSFCAGDLDKVTACIENAKYNPAFDELAKDQKKHPSTCTFDDIQTQMDGDKATVKLSGTMLSPPGKPQKFASVINLHKGDGGWHILPDKAAASKEGSEDPVNAIACALIDPNTLTRARDSARTVSCISNMKQLALGVLMFVEDYDEKYALKADSYKKAISPYIKNDQIFHCPSDDAGVVSYSFNPHLAGIKLAKVSSPATTVMLYEGKAGKLNYKHNGKAGVAFADGHVKMVAEADAKNLRWMP